MSLQITSAVGNMLNYKCLNIVIQIIRDVVDRLHVCDVLSVYNVVNDLLNFLD